jgi:hypothetical protein
MKPVKPKLVLSEPARSFGDTDVDTKGVQDATTFSALQSAPVIPPCFPSGVRNAGSPK